MNAGTAAATLALYSVPAYRGRLPESAAQANPAVVGILLGAACWLGELPNSFLKRRLGIPPGKQRSSPAGLAISIVDQADWVLVAWLLLRPVYKLSAREAVQRCSHWSPPSMCRSISSATRSVSEPLPCSPRGLPSADRWVSDAPFGGSAHGSGALPAVVDLIGLRDVQRSIGLADARGFGGEQTFRR